MAKKEKTPIEKFQANQEFFITSLPGLITIVEYLKDQPQLIHAANILAKAVNLDKKETGKILILNKLIDQYLKYFKVVGNLSNYNDTTIKKASTALDSYYVFFEKEKIEGTFDSRGKIRSTILEEFTYLFLKKKVNDIITKKCGPYSSEIKCGSTKAYSNLYITGKELKSFVEEPLVRTNDKDQDYAIYREIPIVIPKESGISKSIRTIVNVPILAIENKTFLDKTMLDGAIATADKLKSGNPHAKYLIVTETYAVADDVDPSYSKIDQIFVLRKCKHDKKNRIPNPIFPEVLGSLLKLVDNHLNKTWSDVSSRMTKEGLII